MKVQKLANALVILLSAFTLFGVQPCLAKMVLRPYMLSELVQKVAYDPSSGEYKVLGQLERDYPNIVRAQMIVLYLDALTATDIIAKKRAFSFGRGVSKEDVNLAFYLACFPFGPPHKPDKELRFKLIKGLYADSEKRQIFLEGIRIDLLQESMEELAKKKRTLSDILDRNAKRRLLNGKL